jgi:Transposase DDE domain
MTCAGDTPPGSTTSSRAGRTVTIHPHEAHLQAARRRQREPGWRADHRAHRPTVERKAGPYAAPPTWRPTSPHAGPAAVAQDFRLLAAAVNLARLAALGIGYRPSGWTVAAA